MAANGNALTLALILPVVIGNWSDTIRSRLGARMPFVLAGAAICVVGLASMPVFSGSLWGIGFSLACSSSAISCTCLRTTRCFPTLCPSSSMGVRKVPKACSAQPECWRRWHSAASC